MLLLILITQNNENYIDFDALNSKQMHITSEYVTYNNKKQLHGIVNKSMLIFQTVILMTSTAINKAVLSTVRQVSF